MFPYKKQDQLYSVKMVDLASILLGSKKHYIGLSGKKRLILPISPLSSLISSRINIGGRLVGSGII